MIAKQPCPACSGSGQIRYFQGVSRFLLSCEECPECTGLGYQLEPPSEARPVEAKAPGPGRRDCRNQTSAKRRGKLPR